MLRCNYPFLTQIVNHTRYALLAPGRIKLHFYVQLLHMKLLAIITVVLFLACNNRATESQNKKDTLPADETPGTKNGLPSKDTVSWIEDFKDFRDAVYQKQKQKVKTYFSFPVQQEQNEIWYLVEEENTTGKTTFSEKDFDLHFEKIFPPAFVKTVLKIKSADLYSKGEAESPEVKEGDTQSYQMFATFDSTENILSLNLAFKIYYQDAEEWGEHNAIYRFLVLPGGRLRFQRVNMAG